MVFTPVVVAQALFYPSVFVIKIFSLRTNYQPIRRIWKIYMLVLFIKKRRGHGRKYRYLPCGLGYVRSGCANVRLCRVIKKIEGLKYSYIGAIIATIYSVNKSHSKRWFCSEAIYFALTGRRCRIGIKALHKNLSKLQVKSS